MESQSLKKPMSCRQRGCRCFMGFANGKKKRRRKFETKQKDTFWGLRIKSREDCQFCFNWFIRFCECNLCIYRWAKRLLHLLFRVYRNHSLGQATRHWIQRSIYSLYPLQTFIYSQSFWRWDWKSAQTHPETAFCIYVCRIETHV